MTKKGFASLFIVAMIGTLSNVQGAVPAGVVDGMISAGHLHEFVADHGNTDVLAVPNAGDAQINFDTICQVDDQISFAFQPKKYCRATENAPYKACIYFTLGPVEHLGTPFRHAGAGHERPMGGFNKIYFPLDGKQPTTREASKWSCATVDEGNQNSPVTKWYMAMFGVATEMEVPSVSKIRAGYDIADSKKLMNTEDLLHTGGYAPFVTAFKELAANPVGRVLLYRILIEVRRTRGGVGAAEEGIVLTNAAERLRNWVRRIRVIVSLTGSAYCPNAEYDGILGLWGADAQIRFDPMLSGGTELQSVADAVAGHSELRPVLQHRGLDVALFHEMLHWYHNLRQTVRYLGTKSMGKYKYVVTSYYGAADEAVYEWATPNAGNGVAIDEEEVMTILGSPDPRDQRYNFLIAGGTFYGGPAPTRVEVMGREPWRYVPSDHKFLNGDDMSENVYRASKRSPMRFGHGMMGSNVYCYGNRHPGRIRLAHKVAKHCYEAILGRDVNDWELTPGQALLP